MGSWSEILTSFILLCVRPHFLSVNTSFGPNIDSPIGHFILKLHFVFLFGPNCSFLLWSCVWIITNNHMTESVLSYLEISLKLLILPSWRFLGQRTKSSQRLCQNTKRMVFSPVVSIIPLWNLVICTSVLHTAFSTTVQGPSVTFQNPSHSSKAQHVQVCHNSSPLPGPSICLSYFCVAMIRYHDQGNLEHCGIPDHQKNSRTLLRF